LAVKPKICWITYYFPPMGMGGIQRVFNIPKNLKKLGWDVDICTPYPPYAYPKDNELLKTVRLNIIRSFCPDPLHILPRRFSTPGTGKRDYFSFPDNKIFWLPFLWRKLRSADVMVFSCPPFSLMFTTFIAKNTPFIIDYRDQWTDSYLGSYFFKWEESLAKKIERKCIDRAYAVVTVTEKTRNYLSSKYPANKNKIHLIRNGFAEENFPKNHKIKKSGKFIITYMGSFTDIFNPNPIFDGFEKLFSLKPELRQRIVFKYIGPSMMKILKEKAKKVGLKNFIFTGHLPQKEALAELMTSDLLLLLGGSGDQDGWLMPGKLYQYLRTGLPIIAITKNKEIKNIIGSSGIICDPESASFAAAILKIIREYNSFKPIPDYPEYSWENLSKKYSEILMGIL
jgi:glycosyltransferase involved in cell wall biosynthesis